MMKQNNVELKTESLSNLLGLSFENDRIVKKNSSYNLTVPDYQRIYCWEEKNVLKLLDDIKDFTNNKYHLGNIILHKISNNEYNIVDGQQRLVTLSLLLLALQNDINCSILNAKFESDEAQNHIAYNKWLIGNYIYNDCYKNILADILNNLQFSVLIINDGSLDLAYTFFTNQNSRGKSLTDYDLLKAHHLRFIYIPDQAKHMAERWDSIILKSDNDNSEKDLGRTFGVYLFRLRKWMRKKEWSNDEKYKVKTEFEAASIVKEIPPFGEQFNFYESIQGGTHFFAYADHFIFQFKTFSKTKEYLYLQNHLSYENHYWYRDVIEAFLFAYYLKFGTIYLSEALLGITRIMSNHRFSNARSYLKSVLKFAGESEIIMMIDQATSPTFFLAEMQQSIKLLARPTSLSGTRLRFLYHINSMENELKEECNCIIIF